MSTAIENRTDVQDRYEFSGIGGQVAGMCHRGRGPQAVARHCQDINRNHDERRRRWCRSVSSGLLVSQNRPCILDDFLLSTRHVGEQSGDDCHTYPDSQQAKEFEGEIM